MLWFTMATMLLRHHYLFYLYLYVAPGYETSNHDKALRTICAPSDAPYGHQPDSR